MTPTLSFQLYAQPFLTRGNYSDLRQLADPRAEDYDDRFTPYGAVTPNDFNFKQFRSNSVLRWEYRPGSVIFFVRQRVPQPVRHARGQHLLDQGVVLVLALVAGVIHITCAAPTIVLRRRLGHLVRILSGACME